MDKVVGFGRRYWWVIWPTVVAAIFHLQFFLATPRPAGTNDSVGYLAIANTILHGGWPQTDARTPLYPLFLAILGNNQILTTWVQLGLTIAAVSVFCLVVYWLIGNKLAAMVAGFISIFCLQALQFYTAILTETLAITAIMAFLAVHSWSLRRQPSWRLVIAWVIVDAAVLLIKPNYLFLPFTWYGGLLLLAALSRSEAWFANRWQKWAVALLSVVVVVGLYCGVNLYRYGSFSFSTISSINMIGKLQQYGYLDQPAPADAPEEVKLLVRENLSLNNPGDVWALVLHLQAKELYSTELLEATSSYYVKQHLLDYLWQSVLTIPAILSNAIWYIVWPTKVMGIPIGPIVEMGIWLRQLILPASLIVLGWVGFGLWRRQWMAGLTGMLWLLVFGINFGTTMLFSYAEYTRLLAPTIMVEVGIIVFAGYLCAKWLRYCWQFILSRKSVDRSTTKV